VGDNGRAAAPTRGVAMRGLFLVHFQARGAGAVSSAVRDVAEPWMPLDVRVAYGATAPPVPSGADAAASRRWVPWSRRPVRNATDTASVRPATPSFR
jgi:hypothetical protein